MKFRSVMVVALVTILGIGAGLYGLEKQDELVYWAGIYMEGSALGINLGYLMAVLDRGRRGLKNDER